MDRDIWVYIYVRIHIHLCPNGVEVAVQNRAEANQDECWVGVATRIVKEHRNSGSVGRVRHDAGDLEVAVVWKDR